MGRALEISLFITLVAYALLLHLLARFAYRHGKTILGELNVIEKSTMPKAPSTFVSVDDVSASLPQIVEAVNRMLHAAASLMLADDTSLALKWMAGLYAFALASRLLGSTGLFFLLFVCAFTLPKGYEQKKEEVDQAAAMLLSKAKELSAVAVAKLGELRKAPTKPAAGTKEGKAE